jgi:hypothetical protein
MEFVGPERQMVTNYWTLGTQGTEDAELATPRINPVGADETHDPIAPA